LTDAAAQIRFEDTDSLAGRIGARVAKTWAQGDRNAITLWGRVNLWNEFMGDTKTEFSSAAGFVPLHADLGGDWVEFNAGITAEITDRLSAHTNVSYETDFNDQQQSVEMQLGLRLSW
jgi:outer membrane autotransporter protein